MSNVLNKLHEADQPLPEQWYLRTDDGSVYGPVTIPVMRDWAAQSRVAPGDEVSPDGEKWLRAETVPDLKMDWMAVLSDGSSYGPFNVLAVPNLCKNGSIPADASLIHAASGKTVKVTELLQSQHEEREAREGPRLEQALTTLQRKHDALVERSSRREKEFTEQIAVLTSEMEDARAAVEKLTARNREYSEQVLSLAADAETARKELEGTVDQLKQLNGHYEQLKQESAKQMEELDAQNEAFISEKQSLHDANLQIEEDRARTQRLIEQLKENMSQSDGSADQLQKKLTAATDELNDLRRQSSIETDNLKRKVTELERKVSATADQLERASGTVSAKSAEIESARSQSASLQEKLSREIQQLQQSLKSQKETYEAELSRETQKVTDLAAKLDHARENVKADSSMLQQTSERISQLEHELAARESAFSGDRQRMESALHAAQGAGRAMTEKIQTLEGQLANDATGLNRTIAELRAQIEKQSCENRQAMDAASEQIKSFKESAAEHARLEADLQSTLSRRTSELEDIRHCLSETDSKVAGLNDSLQKANQTIDALHTKNKSLDVSLQTERTGMISREQNLKDETVLFRARVKELEIELDGKTEESNRLNRRVEELEKQTAELTGTLSARNIELEETRKTLDAGTESLRRSISEKDTELSRLADEVLSLQQALQTTENTLKALQTDYRRIQEESSERETELRAAVASASEQFSELRDASDLQISGLETISSELRTKLETTQTDNRQITARLESTLSRLVESERNAEKQKHSLDSKITHLEDLLEKKSSALETVTVNLNSATEEASKNEDKLRTAIRMLEKRDIAGRKLIYKLETDVKELQDTKRELTRQNGTLIEEVKDAVAQLKLLRKQVEPLNRKIEVQEEILRRRISRAGEMEDGVQPASSALLAFEKLQILLQKLKSELTLRRLIITISAVLLIFVSMSAVKKYSRPVGLQESSSSGLLQKKIDTFIAIQPDLSVKPVSGPVRSAPPARVNAWPGINIAGIEVAYGDFEAELNFNSPAFSSGASLTATAKATIESLLEKYDHVLNKYRITVTGLAEQNFTEAGGSAMEDYSLRIKRAEAVRIMLLTDLRIQSLNVSTVAGTQSDPAGRSVIIYLSPLP